MPFHYRHILLACCLCGGGSMAHADVGRMLNGELVVSRPARAPLPLHTASRLRNWVAMATARPPLHEVMIIERLSGMARRTYRMTLRHWPVDEPTASTDRHYTVVLTIPDEALRKRALLLVDDGLARDPDASNPAPLDASPEAAASIARATRTIVASVSTTPDPHRRLDDAPAPSEESRIARSWAAFMETERRMQLRAMPIEAAMTIVVSQAMALAEEALARWDIDRFIVVGAGPRGGVAWLSALMDDRVDAIVPVAFDMVDTRANLLHLYHTYGKRWPVTFEPYARHGIDAHIESPEFAALMEIVDPLAYRQRPYRTRLSIPKYIINATGDAFHPADATSLYYDQLPGGKTLRMVPNTGGSGMRGVVERSLIAFVNRSQKDAAAPRVDATSSPSGEGDEWHVRFSENPVNVVMWHASNPSSRDFRHACGVRFTPSTVPFTPATGEGPPSASVSLTAPRVGWDAAFIEATFADGMVATTPVRILPRRYPDHPPPQAEGRCATLPPRVD